MQQSLFTASMRSFLVGLFGTIGVGFGLAVFIIIIAAGNEAAIDQTEIKMHFKPAIVANQDNVRNKLSDNAPVILKLNVKGVIGADHLTMDNIRQQLIESREETFKNNRVKAVLVHINTPGGTAVDSDGIYRTLLEYKNEYKTPIYAFVDGGCLSGGMYIACACDKVYATDVSIIGSVGILSGPFFNVHQALEKLGVEAKTLTQGKDKDEMNPFRPWKPDESKEIEAVMQDLYTQFVDIVAKARPLVTQKILKEDLGAGIFSTKDAVSIGLVDGGGATLGSTLSKLALDADIDTDYQVIELEPKSWVSTLFNNETDLLKGKITHHLKFDPNLNMMR